MGRLEHRIVGFGEDREGEFYVLDHTAGTLHRIVPNPEEMRESTFPRKLSESGLFSSVAEHVPAPGAIPYSINAKPWVDHAVAERLVAVPYELSINAAGATWTFPQDSVLVKTLWLEMEHGDPLSRRRVETQLLHFDGIDWQPYTYEWNNEQTDASLIDAAGRERTFEIVDSAAPGGKRQQAWRFSGRAECQRCHNKWSGPPLAFNTPQLNQRHDYSGAVASQLDTLAHIGLIEKLDQSESRPRLADPRDTSADLDARARAYLHANCAHCHRMHAGSSVLSKMHYDLPLAKTDMIGVRPTQGTFGIHAAEVIAPGDPFRSVLLYRMAKLGPGRMPHIGSTEVDREGLALIHEWLLQLPADASRDTESKEAVARIRREEAAALERLHSAGHSTEQAQIVDRMLSSTTAALMLSRSIDDCSLPPAAVTLAIDRASVHDDASIRELFERFLPPEKRVKRLGSVVQADQILSLPGDPARGRRVFFETEGVQCKACHRVHDQGSEMGPDLTAIGKKYDRGQLLESILEPSRFIDPKYVTYLVETTEGRLLTGLLVKKDEGEVVLRDAQNQVVRIPANQVEQLVAQRQSLMPDLLVRDLTAQQVADLLDYLGSLR